MSLHDLSFLKDVEMCTSKKKKKKNKQEQKKISVT